MTIIMFESTDLPYFCPYETHCYPIGHTHYVGQAPLADYGICGQLRIYNTGVVREQGQAPIALQR